MRKYWLIGILIIAAALRLYGLDRGDTINDEVFYGFRAVGLLDFDKAETQKTPLEWWDPRATGGQSEIPWWTSLSFHDHPPFVFWVQHIFMTIFGDSIFVMRLPSALLGIVSVYLIYLIGLKLFSEGAALIAAAFFAVTLNNIYISRIGMQEAYVIFFMLLASYFFLKAVETIHSPDKYLIWTGVSLGLVFLTKYNAFILVPIFLIYLLLYKREYFSNKKLWAGAFLAFIIFSPVLIYNFMLYKSAGHFDFQISHIIGRVPEGWEQAPGKEIGTIGERIQNFIPRLIASNSWLFLILFAVSLMFLRNRFIILVLCFLFLLLLLIGPSYRFLTMLTPWMAIAVGAGFRRCFVAGFASGQPRGLLHSREESEKIMPKAVCAFGLAAALIFEIFYSYNNQIAYYPKGKEPWLASKVRYENYNWGYRDLEKYLLDELDGKMPALTFNNRYQFLDDTQDAALKKANAKNLEPYPALIVYYGNFDEGARLWIFDRLNIYHAWPIIPLDTYFQYLRENGADYYQKAGFQKYYFIQSANIVPSAEFQNLIKGMKIDVIRNARGDEVFGVYKF